MNPSCELIRFAKKKPRVTVVREPRPKPGTPFYIAVGIAGALGVLTIIGTAVLLLRETRHVEAATVKPVAAPAEAGVSVVTAAPEPAVTTLPEVAEPAPVAPVARRAASNRRPVVAKTFKGTIWPPPDKTIEPEKPKEPPVETAAAVEPEPQAESTGEPKDESADRAATAASVPSADRPSSRGVKRVLGALSRPFRAKRQSMDQ